MPPDHPLTAAARSQADRLRRLAPPGGRFVFLEPLEARDLATTIAQLASQLDLYHGAAELVVLTLDRRFSVDHNFPPAACDAVAGIRDAYQLAERLGQAGGGMAG